MQSNLYVALSAQVALNRRLEQIAHNVANANTAGFRADGVKFDALVTRRADAKVGSADVAYASEGTTYITRTSGPVSRTGNPLDLAASGEGWFAIATPGGTAFTRDGRFQMTETGALRTVAGDPVLDAGNTPLLLDPSGGAIEVAHDGMISQGGRQVGAVGLFAIDDDATLARVENSAVRPDRPATPILDFTQSGVMQGFVENSNVNPVAEMTRLIAVQRAFENISASLDMTDTTLQDAIKTLGATG